MKANEIQIGDWVHYQVDLGKDGVYEKDIQVKNIYGNEINCEVRHYEIISGKRLCNCKPIPLTPEILEKNGFEKTQIHGEKQDDIFQCFDGEIIIEVGIYDPNFILIHYRYETPDGINSGELSSIVKVDGGKFYLHELQHALRLCGIEKEIVI